MVRGFYRKMFGSLEDKILTAVDAAPQHSPIFIVGPPRAGTTIVYQYLLSQFEFSYFPNIANRFPHSPVAATLAGRMLASYEPTFESEYGQTDGLMGPSDGWEIFHRWFPRYDPSDSVDKENLGELPRIFGGIEVILNGPFLSKNNNNSTRIQHLIEAFSTPIFIHVHRNRRDNAASLLEARRAHGVEVGEWWSVAPPSLADKSFEDDIEQTVRTIDAVNGLIESSLEDHDPSRIARICYGLFCRQPSAVADWVEECYASGVLFSKDWPSPDFEPRSRTLSKEDERRLEELL